MIIYIAAIFASYASFRFVATLPRYGFSLDTPLRIDSH